MKISYNWLKKYIKSNLTPAETADKLTLLGLEVEEIEEIGSDLENFVVGEVLEVRPHPNADKLQICDVNTGNEKVQIICGAKNVAAGQKVPVAKTGATIPVPMKDGSFLTIKKAKLRGEISNGMICSESELGLGDDHSGIMVLDGSLNSGTPLKDVLKSEKDYVFEIGLTPNRPDAACHIGVARDLSAVTGDELYNPYKESPQSDINIDDEITITIEDPDKCHRYVGIVVENVKVDESPDWLKTRLKSIGLRPINNVVDITNFVLHEIGQPLHAFDYNLINGNKIVVKSFSEETDFITLDSTKRKVPAGFLFICDGNGPVAIAGVMGGENSEVTESTTKILIESAYFEPSGIRKTSKQLALQTDSSYRFERGIDPDLQLRAAYRAAKMIAEVTGGTILEGYADQHPVITEPAEVNLRVSRINHLLGTQLEENVVINTLNKLEIGTSKVNDDTLLCNIPTFRPDISREVDLIEEVGRVFDYNNIPRPETAPFFTPEKLSDWEVFNQKLKSIVKSFGYKEITTNSLLSKKEASLLADESLHIDTLNPVSQENTTLRTDLLGGFLKVAGYNFNRNATSLKFFETGHTFRKSDSGTWIEGVEEHSRLLLGLSGHKTPESWQRKAETFTVFDLKKDLEAFFTELNINSELVRKADGNFDLTYTYKDALVAKLSVVKNELLKAFDVEHDVFTAEVDITRLFELGVGSRHVTYTAIPKYPSFEFDAAFIVDKQVRAGEMADQIKKAAGSILKSVSVFDVYEGENIGNEKKSIAFRLTFLDSTKTLTIKDVEPVVKKIVQQLEKSAGAKLRS